MEGRPDGNLVFHSSARNFNPLAAMAGLVTIAEVEHMFDPGELGPDEIHLPVVYVHRVVALTLDETATVDGPAEGVNTKVELHPRTAYAQNDVLPAQMQVRTAPPPSRHTLRWCRHVAEEWGHDQP